jgi:CheY-like chemotaxis protein
VTQKYHILWFDDSKDFVEPRLESIKEHIESLGFELIHEVTPDDSLLDEKWLKKLDPDLILVDYGLGKGKKGDEVVEKIRKIEPYADVVFYSGKLEDYIEKIGRKIDGIYFTIRADLVEKTRNVINRTVRKQQEPNNMRGVIIAEAVDIEGKMENLILIALGPDAERKNVIKKIMDPEWHILNFQNKYDLVNKICKERIKALRVSRNTATPTRRTEIDTLMSEISLRKQAFVDAKEEVIEIRNVMAHAAEDPNTGCLVSYVRRNSPITVDDGFCKKTRKDLQKHSKNLDELITLISKGI